MSRSYRYRRERYPRQRSRGLGCLSQLVILVWLVLALVLGYQFFLRPQVSEYIGDRIADQTNPQTPSDVQGQINDQAAQSLPTAVAALPSGQIQVSEQQANDFLAGRSLGPIDSATVSFVPGEMQVELTAFGITSTAHAGLAVENGRIVTVNPRIDGVLGSLISLDDLSSSLEDQLNAQLAQQERTVRSVEIGQGVLTLDVE